MKRPTRQPADTAISNQVLIAIRRIIQSVDLHSRALVRQFGLTGPQLIVLQTISVHQEVAINEIAKAVSLGQPTVTGILERLEQRGLIERRRGRQDKRKVYITVTASARQLLEKAPPLLQQHFIESFHRLADWEQAMILSSLQRVVALMNARDIDAAPILAEAGPLSGVDPPLPKTTPAKRGRPGKAKTARD